VAATARDRADVLVVDDATCSMTCQPWCCTASPSIAPWTLSSWFARGNRCRTRDGAVEDGLLERAEVAPLDESGVEALLRAALAVHSRP